MTTANSLDSGIVLIVISYGRPNRRVGVEPTLDQDAGRATVLKTVET